MINYGKIGILGKTNVGKSTIINMLMGKKVTITSKKIKTTKIITKFLNNFLNFQFLYIDTPGFYINSLNFCNNYKNIFKLILQESDIILFVIDIYKSSHNFINLIDFYNLKKPIILLINKIDLLKKKSLVLPIIEKFLYKNFSEIVPISSYSINDINKLKKKLKLYLPKIKSTYKVDIYKKDINFICLEILREKILKLFNKEIPYKINFILENIIINDKFNKFFYKIFIYNLSHKKIIIGKNGIKLNNLIKEVEIDIKKIFNFNIYVFIKIKFIK